MGGFSTDSMGIVTLHDENGKVLFHRIGATVITNVSGWDKHSSIQSKFTVLSTSTGAVKEK
jgi:hypothetical protein